MFPTLTKQTILYIIQKAMPIILTLFSTIMWFLSFSNYSGNNLPRPTADTAPYSIFPGVSRVQRSRAYLSTGVSNLWNGLWNGLMEWTDGDGVEYQLTQIQTHIAAKAKL